MHKETEVPIIQQPKKMLVVSVWRGSHNQYRIQFREWFARLMIEDLVSMTQSESDGNISITLVYK